MKNHFRHNFQHDFDAATIDGPPYALARFADGERAILEGDGITGADGWQSATASPLLRETLWNALHHDQPGYWLGISCPCCDADGHRWYLDNAGTKRLTYSNLFVNANYDRFLYRVIRESWLQRCLLVGPYTSAHIRLPANAVNDERFSVDGIVKELAKAEQPILVAGGPAANAIIYKYWKSPGKKQIILDIGSALDPVFGRQSRGYHNPHHPNRKKSCVWSQ